MVNATVTATISPATNVPYGATATVTATVSIPNSNAISPSGTATAVLQGITGATYSNTLIPNSSSNTATTNIPVSVPPPGTYTIAVTCTSTSNYACQSPVNLSVTSIKGMSAVTISVSPTAPLAGQPTVITATGRERRQRLRRLCLLRLRLVLRQRQTDRHRRRRHQSIHHHEDPRRQYHAQHRCRLHRG